MNAWIPIIGTLAGALVAGGMSLVLLVLANRHAQRVLSRNLMEDRARWAAERQLDQLRAFYAAIEELALAAAQLRIQQAWSAMLTATEKAPDRVLPPDVARGAVEKALRITWYDSLFLDDRIRSSYRQVLNHYDGWFLSKTVDEGVGHLLNFENALRGFRHELAKKYRDIFDDRRTGSDVAGWASLSTTSKPSAPPPHRSAAAPAGSPSPSARPARSGPAPATSR